MGWNVEGTVEFEEWFLLLEADAARAVNASVEMLRQFGPLLKRPAADTLKGSKYSNLKELRPTQTIRVFFAFDPRRVAVLLIGGDKENDPRFYETMTPRAEDIYAEHLKTLGDA